MAEKERRLNGGDGSSHKHWKERMLTEDTVLKHGKESRINDEGAVKHGYVHIWWCTQHHSHYIYITNAMTTYYFYCNVCHCHYTGCLC